MTTHTPEETWSAYDPDEPDYSALAHPPENTSEKVDRVLRELAEIRTTLDDSRTIIEKVAAEVKPVLDALMKNSMLKMFLGGGK